MNPNSPSPTHEQHVFDSLNAETHYLVLESIDSSTRNPDFDKDDAQFTESQNIGEGKEATNPHSNQEGKIALDLNFPYVDTLTGCRIVNGAIYIDSDDDDDVDTDTREQYSHTRTKYSTVEKGKAIIVEGEEDAVCDSWLTLRLGPPSMHQFCGQVLGSTSGTKNNEVMRDLVLWPN